VIVWPSSRFTGLSVPDNWKSFAAAHPVAARAPGTIPKEDPDPATDVIVLPFLLSIGLSARSGLTFMSRRRRLRS
jgi:signal peptidase I